MKDSEAKKVWKELFKPECSGKLPWDSTAQHAHRCGSCPVRQECFREIKRKAKKNYEEAMKSNDLKTVLSKSLEGNS